MHGAGTGGSGINLKSPVETNSQSDDYKYKKSNTLDKKAK